MNFNPQEHMMNLKGKQYLQVMWRIVWFREALPNWSIDTTALEIAEDHAVFVCKISDENGTLKASGHGSESKKDFGDFIEKAETKAIGRALAMMGFGTQFAPELDEGERIVDSPVAKMTKEQVQPYLDYVVPFGQDAGKKLSEVYKIGKQNIDLLRNAATGKNDAETLKAIAMVDKFIAQSK